MTTSNIVALEIIAEEEEMPTISTLTHRNAGEAFILFEIKVPTGYKLVLKKAGVFGPDAPPNHIKMRFIGDYIDEFIGEYSHELNAELSAGKRVACYVYNLAGTDLDIGGWFMFDFIPIWE